MIATAFTINYAVATGWHGVPRTATGSETPFSLFGLGNFGGAALGYASDIELLFVYSDAGTTDGPETIPNHYFFESVIRDTYLSIHAKREGIFRIDARLRPFGNDGPLAVPLKSFIDYYRKDGSAHAAERLALTRLRPVFGDHAFSSLVERLRDEMIYETDSINPQDIISLRKRQYEVKSVSAEQNAKFSPGGGWLILNTRFSYCKYGSDTRPHSP